jgi:glycosyltransferase involved in cell wall biosynthesis
MRIAILAGGQWHESELERGLQACGIETLLLNASVLVEERPVLGRVSDFLVRISNRFPIMLTLSRLFFYGASRSLVRRFNPSVLIIWASFALEYQKKEGWPVVLVRGSSHIQQQREIFELFPEGKDYKNEKGPSRRAISRELSEYSASLLVTVPTIEISKSQLWGSTNLAVNPYGFSPNEFSIDRKNRPFGPSIRLLFAGQTSLRKGIDRLGEIAVQGKDLSLSVYGPLVQPKSTFENSNVVYRGNLSRLELHSEYQKHDIFVLLSREEGMARAGMEAVSAGMPIVVTRATGLSIWCELGAGICLEDEYTQNQFGEAISTITSNINQFEKTCFEVARGWTWENHAELLISQIKDALERK